MISYVLPMGRGKHERFTKPIKATFEAVYAKIGKVVVFITLVTVWIVIIYQALYWNRILPGITIANISLGGKTSNEASALLSTLKPPKSLVFRTPSKEFSLASDKISLSYDYNRTAQYAYNYGREGGTMQRIKEQWTALITKPQLPLYIMYQTNEVQRFFEEIKNLVETPSVEAEISIKNNIALVDPGKIGQRVDEEMLWKNMQSSLQKGRDIVLIPLVISGNGLTQQQADELSSRAQSFVGTKLLITLGDTSVTISDSQLVTFLTPKNTYNTSKIQLHIEVIANQLNRPAQEPTFRFENGKVVEFRASKDGVEVEKDKLVQLIIEALKGFESGILEKQYTLNPPVIHIQPKIATEEVNNLGIKELIGRGSSRFKGSIASRMHNIELASSKLNGILIAPGEEFSFNNALGDVSTFTGYQQAYIIKDGKTILGDGGGVCQVSTTFFRAALNTGLPILERKPHSYRVSYYEQDIGPGFDATVYQPSPDLKIKNDTPTHILIQTKFDRANATLVFEFYGASDGRVATVSKSKMWGTIPAPPDVYQDDPNLPVGIVKQTEHRANGAKVLFDYKVVRGNEVLQERTFYSVYRPWGAVYLRGIATQ